MALSTGIASEASGALRLASNLERSIRVGTRGRHFTRESRAVISYATDTIQWIRERTSALLTRTPTDATALAVEVRRLGLARLFLAILHAQVRRVLDADTLHIPFSLARVLNDLAMLFRADAKIVLTATDDLNWYTHPTRAALDVDNAPWPRPPAGLGVISLPYSECGAALANALLFHELGHYLFETHGRRDDLQIALDKSLYDAGLRDSQLQQVVTLTLQWAQEFYCDLLASFLSGPAFLIAFLDVLRLLRSSSKMYYAPQNGYPSDAYRLTSLRDYLRRRGAYDEIRSDFPAVDSQLAAIAAGAPKSGVWNAPAVPGGNDLGVKARDSFVTVAAPLLAAAADASPTAAAFQVQNYLTHREAIWECLSHGIVPSAASINRSIPKSTDDIRESTLFLACQIFSLNGYPGWSELFGDHPDALAGFAERLDELLLKSMDDIHFVRTVTT